MDPIIPNECPGCQTTTTVHIGQPWPEQEWIGHLLVLRCPFCRWRRVYELIERAERGVRPATDCEPEIPDDQSTPQERE